MKPTVVGSETLKEFFTEEQCFIAEIYNEPSDRSHSLARTRVKPGVTTSWHLLKGTSEIYYILEGTGHVEVGDNLIQSVTAGDSVCIPADTRQRITNTGTVDLLFLCVCKPAFDPACYVPID